MFSLKFTTFLIVSVIIDTVAPASCISRSGSDEEVLCHNITWGARSPRDVHLSRHVIAEKAKTMRVITKDFSYQPKPGELAYERTITQIVVTDNYTNGNGGYAVLKDGGPSTYFALIHLKSQRGHGFNFTIDFYGQ
uniref:Salivary secreted peptide n=1 Tax=Glossina brevipalpis TaxID=37001 RepID=A0A1A9X4F4_9MUSC